MLGNCNVCGDFKEVKEVDINLLNSYHFYPISYHIVELVCNDCYTAREILKKLEKQKEHKNKILQQKRWKKYRDFILKKEKK